jgi:hypothetical protein
LDASNRTGSREAFTAGENIFISLRINNLRPILKNPPIRFLNLACYM